MGKAFPAMFALEWLLSSVDTFVLLQMMLEFEGLSAFATLELAQVRAVVVIGHVSLQLGQVGKLLRTDGARLSWEKKGRNM